MPFDIDEYIGEQEAGEEFNVDSYIGEPQAFDIDKYIGQVPSQEEVSKWSMEDAWENLTNAMHTVADIATTIGGKFEKPTWREPLGLSRSDIVDLVRLLPGNEDLAPFEQQSRGRQILTVAQAASIPLVIAGLAYEGITTIQGIRGWMKMNKAYLKEKFPTGRKLGIVGKEYEGAYTFTKDGRLVAKKTKTIGWKAKAPKAVAPSAEQLAREAKGRAAMIKGAGVKTEEELGKLLRKYELAQTQQIRAIDRSEFRDSLEEAIYEGLDTIPNATLSQELKIERAKALADELVTNLAPTFSPKVAAAVISRAPRYVPKALREVKIEPVQFPLSEIAKSEGPIMANAIKDFRDANITTYQSNLGGRGTYPSVQTTSYDKERTWIWIQPVEEEIKSELETKGFYVKSKMAAVGTEGEELEQVNEIGFVVPFTLEGESANVYNRKRLSELLGIIKRAPSISRLHYLARYLDETGIDRMGRNEILNIVRDTKGEITDQQIRRVAVDFLDSEARSKEFSVGEKEDLPNRYTELSDDIHKAIADWKALGKPKAEIADEALVLATTEQKIKLGKTLVDAKLTPKRALGLMETVTGKTDIDRLTESEIGIFINALEATPRTRIAGRIKLSSKTDLIPSDYYAKKKRAVKFGMQLVPAWRVMEWIGVKEEIYDKLEEVLINKSVEEADKFHMFGKWRKQVGSSRAVAMKLSDWTNGLIPDEAMTPDELEVGAKIRALMNEYADRMGLPPERRKKFYMIHLFDAMARQEINKANPMPDEYLDALDFSVPKAVFTKTLLHRLGREQGLIRDIWKELRAVTSIDLRNVHLEPGLKAARAYMRRGWVDEKGRMHSMPKTSRDYIRDWINIAVLKKHAKIDDEINEWLKPVNDFMIKYTKGKVSMGSNPAKTAAYAYTRLGYGGTMTLNIAIAGKNVTQQFLILPLLRDSRNYVKAWSFRFSDRGRALLGESKVLKARFPMEMFDPKDIQGWMRYGMIPYRAADWLNVSQAFLSGYLDAIDQKMSYNEAIKYADRVAKISQYSYRPFDMPEFMWKGGALGRGAGMLQTWPLNYWFNYMPELSYRLATGKGTDGSTVSLSQRAGLLQYIALTSAFIYAMYKYAKSDYSKIFGPGVIPTQLSPPMTLSLNLGKRLLGMATGDYRMVRDADRALSPDKLIPVYVPGGLQSKKIHDAYMKIAEGLERDSYGRIRRNVTMEEAIRGTFTYPAERSEYWRVQNKVWDLGLQIDDARKQLKNTTLTYKQQEKLMDKVRKLSIELAPYKRDLARLDQGLPAEETNQTFSEQMKRIWLGR